MFPKGLANLRRLESKLAGWDENKTLDFGALGVDAFERRDNECSGFAGSVLCTGKDISASECDWDSFFLDG